MPRKAPITVFELIQQLRGFDPETPVYIQLFHDNMEVHPVQKAGELSKVYVRDDDGDFEMAAGIVITGDLSDWD